MNSTVTIGGNFLGGKVQLALEGSLAGAPIERHVRMELAVHRPDPSEYLRVTGFGPE
jgi:hypothetical protein